MWWLVIFALLITAPTFEVRAVKAGNTKITLEHKYYSSYDLTRLKYRVKTDNKKDWPDAWVLAMGPCLSDESIVWWASMWFEWVDAPFRGLRFEVYDRNETYYVWLKGQWDVGSVDFATIYGYGDDPEILYGQIDGPLCAGSSVSVEVLSGETVEFPEILETGRVDLGMTTRLRVTSTSAGWSLDHDVALNVPDGAREDIVREVFEVNVLPYNSVSGTAEIDVAYALSIDEEDLVGLPEGSYVLAIAYTVTAD